MSLYIDDAWNISYLLVGNYVNKPPYIIIVYLYFCFTFPYYLLVNL